MDFLQIIMTPFSWLLEVFCNLFNSYGIALILFTIVVKIILFPFNLKGKKGMMKTTMMSSQLREIQARCGNDKERYNREVQKFYTENKISPGGGCLWSLIPLLILMPLYAIIRRPFRYMMGLSDTAISAVAGALDWEGVMGAEYVASANELALSSMLTPDNLAAAEAAAGSELFIINFDFLGLDLSLTPSLNFWADGISWGSVGLFLMPIISAGLSLLSMIVSQRTNRVNRGDAAAPTNRSMYLISPLMSLWIGYSLPAGLCIYWIANSLLMMVQEVLAGKILRNDYLAMQKEMEEQARKAKEEEKERRRIAAERKAAAIAAGTYRKGRKSQHAGKEKGMDLTASREGIRAYARGRAYDPNRYPITPYHDPNDRYRKKKPEEDPAHLTEEEKAILTESGVPLPEEESVKAPETSAPAAGETAAPAQEEAPQQPEERAGDGESQSNS